MHLMEASDMSILVDSYEAAFEAKFLACFARNGVAVKTGGSSRPSTVTIETLANRASYGMNAKALRVAESDPFLALRIVAKYHLPLTIGERAEIAKTPDGKHQPIDPATGHIVQNVRGGIDCGGLDDVEWYFENVALGMARGFAYRSGKVQFVRLARWAATRKHRTGNGVGLKGRTAPFAHKIYVHSDTSKKRAAFLTLAIVHPDGTVERLAKPRSEAASAASKAVPATDAVQSEGRTQKAILAPAIASVEIPAETKSQRDARRKREKRAEAKLARA